MSKSLGFQFKVFLKLKLLKFYIFKFYYSMFLRAHKAELPEIPISFNVISFIVLPTYFAYYYKWILVLWNI